MGRSTGVGSICLAFVLTFTATATAATPPVISYSIDGIVGTNGWYRGSTQGDNVILQLVGIGTAPPPQLPADRHDPGTHGRHNGDLLGDEHQRHHHR